MTAVDRPEPRPYAARHRAGATSDAPIADRPENAVTPATFGSAMRDARQRRRLSSRIPIGAAIGVAAGASVGAIVGAIGFASSGGILASALAGALALGLLGAFWGGMASLGSTDPGAEPAQGREPLSANAGVPRGHDALARRPEATQPPRRSPR